MDFTNLPNGSKVYSTYFGKVGTINHRPGKRFPVGVTFDGESQPRLYDAKGHHISGEGRIYPLLTRDMVRVGDRVFCTLKSRDGKIKSLDTPSHISSDYTLTVLFQPCASEDYYTSDGRYFTTMDRTLFLVDNAALDSLDSEAQPTDFTSYPAGTRVLDTQRGPGAISDNRPMTCSPRLVYPVTVAFDSGGKAVFTADGRFSTTSKRTLYLLEDTATPVLSADVPADFSNFIGHRVHCSETGKSGVLVLGSEPASRTNYPLRVNHDDGTYSVYTKDGRFWSLGEVTLSLEDDAVEPDSPAPEVKEPPHSLKGIKPGDRVWSPHMGWGEVVSTNNSLHYPIRVQFDGGRSPVSALCTFTDGGSIFWANDTPTPRILFWGECNPLDESTWPPAPSRTKPISGTVSMFLSASGRPCVAGTGSRARIGAVENGAENTGPLPFNFPN